MTPGSRTRPSRISETLEARHFREHHLMTTEPPFSGPRRVVGRGAGSNPNNRFERIRHLPVLDDGEPGSDPGDARKIETQYFFDRSQSIVSENNSPDIPFRFSLNPYRGCAHGCSYCYARPTHEYLGWSAGLDFETRILVKPDAPELFRKWMRTRESDEIETVMLSGVTDPYQPAERQFELSRGCLIAAVEFRHPVSLITKNRLVTRDLDILQDLAARELVHVAISVTSLDQQLTRVLEPRTSSPSSRLRAITELTRAGVPVSVMVAPLIPGLNDEEVPAILKAVAEAGAVAAGHVPIRLPLTVAPVFTEWLEANFPDRVEKVLNRIRSLRDGKLNDATFGRRLRGQGIWADQFREMFRVFAAAAGLESLAAGAALRPLRTDLFRPVDSRGLQQSKLF